MKKNKTWDAVKYTRTTSLAAGPGGQRMDRFKWKRSLTQLLTATPLNMVKMLRADRILPKWEGKVCPRCEKGTLSGLKLEAGTGMPKHRCSHWKCRVYINPQHLHPLFADGRGAAAQPLQTQAALRMLKLNNISNPAAHRLLHVNHKMIEDLDKRLCHARKTWVEAKEKDIVFGKDQKWADVEADETTFDRMDLGSTAPSPCPQEPGRLGAVVWHSPTWPPGDTCLAVSQGVGQESSRAWRHQKGGMDSFGKEVVAGQEGDPAH